MENPEPGCNEQRPDREAAAWVFLESVRFRFNGIKHLGDGALAQLDDADLAWAPHEEANSIAVIVQHLHGNMISRWTDFLTTDGEKNRDRDAEFVPPAKLDRGELLRLWEDGWRAVLGAVGDLGPEDLIKNVTIRGQSLTVIDAIHRQLAHYAYHVGQMVQIGKFRKGTAWRSLSIPRGQSQGYTPKQRD